MAKFNHKLLKELTDASGIAGFEDEIQVICTRELKKLCKTVTKDPMGSIIGFKPGSKKGKKLKIMLAAHMDEIGFIINYVDDNGFLRILPFGGFDPRALMCQRVWVITQKGEKLSGLLNLGTKPIHLMPPGETAKESTVPDYYVDLGMPEKEVKKKVEIGDFVTMNREYMQIGDCVTNKSMDDRVGVFLMIEALKNVKNNQNDIYAVGTVQEEIGLRGAITSSHGIEPDIAVALDITLAADIIGTEPHQQIARLREGITIKISDGASISDRGLVQEFKKIAKSKKIKHQMEILPRGGTDAGGIQRSGSGCRVITLSIPTRYGHTVNEICAINDVTAGIDLLAEWLNKY